MDIVKFVLKLKAVNYYKLLKSKTNLASAVDNDDVNRLVKKNIRLNAKLNKVREVNNSRIKDLVETLARCTSQLKGC